VLPHYHSKWQHRKENSRNDKDTTKTDGIGFNILLKYAVVDHIEEVDDDCCYSDNDKNTEEVKNLNCDQYLQHSF